MLGTLVSLPSGDPLPEVIPLRIEDPVYNLLDTTFTASRKLLRTIQVMIKIHSVSVCMCVHINKIISQELKYFSALSIPVLP